MAKKPPDAPAEKVALYEQLVASIPEVERKGAANPYTALNGNMFTFLDKTGAVSLRRPQAERDAFIEKHQTRLSQQHGTIMKEYVLVPDQLLQDFDSM